MRYVRQRRFAPVIYFMALASLAALCSAYAESRRVPFPQDLSIDGKSMGRIFDGIGALSAGASSRLLIDYPGKERSQILDYLFKPDYGAGLQILKVEIGGDTNSTDGTEPSHMHAERDLDCARGYEWWLMEQAKKRNTGIRYSALEWGVPGWVGGGKPTVWTDANITYIKNWLECASKKHFKISYLGGWNERDLDANWYVKLKRRLMQAGYGDIELVSADSFSWDDIAKSMRDNPDFKKSVNIIGVHYPCGHLSSSEKCPSTKLAQASGKTLWDSEGGSQPYDTGAEPLAREINRNYIDGRMTAMINWSVIWSAYEGLPFQGSGLMLANTPWSGHYVVGPSLWVVAHTTQFAHPGWRYLDSGSTHLNRGGSVVALRSPNGSDWSAVVETVGATTSQDVRFDVTNGLSSDVIHVWQTDLKSKDPSKWFVRNTDVRPSNGHFLATLQPGRIYSFTTTTGQHRGDAAAPQAKPWKLPYADDFNRYQEGAQARYFSDIGGVFEVRPCVGKAPDDALSGGSTASSRLPAAKGSPHVIQQQAHDLCLQQVVADQPVLWNKADNSPITLIGRPRSWTDYKVSVDARLPEAGAVELAGRVIGRPGLGPSKGLRSGLTGYHFRVSTRGHWRLSKQNAKGGKVVLAQGRVSFAKGAWHRLTLSMQGTRITPSLDGHELKKVIDSTFKAGQVSLAVDAWNQAQFDDLLIESVH